MFIELENGVKDVLKKKISENDFTAVRVRNYKIGSACKSQSFTGISLDNPGDDDTVFETNGIKFIASEDFMDQYGDSFSIYLDENNNIKVRENEK